MAGAVSTVKKPQLRGLLHSQIKKNLIVAVGLSIVSGIAWKLAVCDPHKRSYAEFYKTYDPEREFKIMRNKGLFDSCGPE